MSNFSYPYRVPVSEIVEYYEPKTADLLRRYGPGPRLHYHTGLVDQPRQLDIPSSILRKEIVAAQERLLRYVADVWRAPDTLSGDVVDVGCGLGGGALFWAQEFGAQVTAVTCVPSHIDWIARFAREANVARRVRPLLCDAVEIPGENDFDAAVAIDSTDHLPRKQLFERLSRVLRPGGRFFFTDCLLVQSDYDSVFSRHWHVQFGTLEEYLTVAEQAGFQVDSVDDIASRVEYFYAMTQAMIRIEAAELSLTGTAKYTEALETHALFRQGLIDGNYKYVVMSFLKK